MLETAVTLLILFFATKGEVGGLPSEGLSLFSSINAAVLVLFLTNYYGTGAFDF
jgi:hypothetical protein